jgi:hypothetical protein
MTADHTYHYCRYQKYGRHKLDQPVESKHHAFCSPGCRTAFYRKRCLVCEKPFAEIDQGRAMLVGARQIKRRGTRRFCPGHKCAADYRQNPAKYSPNAKAQKTQQNLENALPGASPGAQPGTNAKASKVPVKWAFKSGLRTGQGWHWQEVPGRDGTRHWLEHWLLDREELVLARLIPVSDRYIVRLTPGIDYDPPSTLEETKRLAISLSLARLPLEPKFAERIARLNELPPAPPQHLLPHTATYLAGIAATTMAESVPSIVPDAIAAGDPLDMPEFLRREVAR